MQLLWPLVLSGLLLAVLVEALPSSQLQLDSRVTLLSRGGRKTANALTNPCVEKCHSTLMKCKACVDERSAAHDACGDEPKWQCHQEAWRACPDCTTYDDCLRAC
mmetsp:Transcript_103074/g.188790  ORF Transcript_103074/g.188790 Transcript_103074/m.188790 type:complete len:105 (-) Transcript_103074:56-370(-)